MDISSITWFGTGFVGGAVAVSLFLPPLRRRLSASYQARLAELEMALRELRQERADDRETNRRLRHELAVNTPEHLASTREERDRALSELEQLGTELRTATTELADRDRSLREARLAIHDIRVHLERGRPVSERIGGGPESRDSLVAEPREARVVDPVGEITLEQSELSFDSEALSESVSGSLGDSAAS